MRQTSYMGVETGAVVTELRQGSVNYIALGSVERFSAGEQALGAPGWKFRPSCRLVGKPAKALASKLSETSLAHHRGQITSDQRMAAVDAAVKGIGL